MAGGGASGDRVVLVRALLPGGAQSLVGTGFLVSADRVVTAWHCTVFDPQAPAPTVLRVERTVTDPGQVPARVGGVAHVVRNDNSWEKSPDGGFGLDVAVLTLKDPPWAGEPFPPLAFARVNRDVTELMEPCDAVGYPRFKVPATNVPEWMPIHGWCRPKEGADATGRHLVVRDSALGVVSDPGHLASAENKGSPWGGISGALVFHSDRVIGHVVRHRSNQGTNTLLVVPITELLARVKDHAGARKVAELLGVGPVEDLPWADDSPPEALEALVEVRDRVTGSLPTVGGLDPYRLGADRTRFGDADSYGQHDPYVPRTAGDVDARLRAAILAASGPAAVSRMVILVGPSKAGKTRTLFEAARQVLPHAVLLEPAPDTLRELLENPGLAGIPGQVVLWLDDLHRYLTGPDALSPKLAARFTTRSGGGVILATLSSGEIARLTRDIPPAPGRGQRPASAPFITSECGAPAALAGSAASAKIALAPLSGELLSLSPTGTSGPISGARQLLNDAREIILAPTSADPVEQATARELYPDAGIGEKYGVGEVLAGAPALLWQYTTADPYLEAVLRVAIDWERAGILGPIGEDTLLRYATKELAHAHPVEEPDTASFKAALNMAKRPPHGWEGHTPGQVCALTTIRSDEGQLLYRPYPYLVAHDDGQDATPRRIPRRFWDDLIRDHAAPAPRLNLIALNCIALAAAERHEVEIALTAAARAAAKDDTNAMMILGMLLSDFTDPPDVGHARDWYEKAANAGHVGAMLNLGVLLVTRINPPDLDGARKWYLKSAGAGNLEAMRNLGLLAERAVPPEVDDARHWYEKAAKSGHVGAMVNLGVLLATGVVPEVDAARHWYEKAAGAGNADALYNLGLLLEERVVPPDLKGARDRYEEAAATGHLDAMVRLGALLAERTVPPDVKGARDWYERAATAGNIMAMNRLGALLAERMVPPDVEGARGWFEKAAKAEDTEGMANLGLLLARYVVPRDVEGANSWLKKAAAAGDSGAMNSLGLLEIRENPPAVDSARDWFEKGARAGHIGATYNLGVLLENQVVPPDLKGARDRYEKAAAAGHLDAMVRLGALLAERTVPPDVKGARDWYERAANAGNVIAMNRLGALLVERMVPPDVKGARDSYENAAKAGHVGAMVDLAVLLATQVDPPDLQGARAWFEEAAKAGSAVAMRGMGILLAELVNPPEVVGARDWYEKAAAGGDAEAQRRLLAMSSEEGEPPPSNASA